MSQTLVQKAVLFADLRGSTSLYEEMGNANATLLVTRSVSAIAETVAPSGGVLIKTLGDGLMAVFDSATGAVQAASDMHACIERASAPTRRWRGAQPARALKLQVAVALGEIAEVAGDVFGDAVNVAARLLDHAGDGETLITAQAHQSLPTRQKNRFRDLDWMHLRGRADPVNVFVLGGTPRDTGAATQFEDAESPQPDPGGIRLTWDGKAQVLTPRQCPVVLGRSPQSLYLLHDPRVSRLHARIDWHGGSFHLTDLSYNGSFVRFEQGPVVALRRTQCTLHGRGEIGLSGAPSTVAIPTVGFEVLEFSDTQP